MPEEFDYPPEDPFIYFGALDPPEQNAVIAELAASAKDRSFLIHELAEVFPEFIQLPKPVDERGISYNSPQLTLIDRKSILYMTQFADPKASRTELAAIFGVSRQRISQIIGAHGGSKADADLLRQFRNTSAEQLRDRWRVEADMQTLAELSSRASRGEPAKATQHDAGREPARTLERVRLPIRNLASVTASTISASTRRTRMNQTPGTAPSRRSMIASPSAANSPGPIRAGATTSGNSPTGKTQRGQPIRRTSFGWATERWTAPSSNSSNRPTSQRN